MTRCVNIDWLEIYCLEDNIGYPHDADYFRRAGWHLEEREFGTPMYQQMFTLYGNDNCPLIEVRRKPKSSQDRAINGLFDPMACHVRLSNRTCYFMEPVRLMQEFLERYGLHFQRISRIDICLDFTTFDYGDNPADFIARYFKGRYAKINQANISAHGKDMWDGRLWNSVSWGQKKSMIGTKFYNKSMELREVHDKPYIRQAWRAAGLIDDEHTGVKYVVNSDGETLPTKPDVWRVEFSIKSSTRHWFVIEDVSGRKRQIRSIRHTLDMYTTKQKLLDMFFSLAEHYFHFKIFKAAQRKDRCLDKLLFRTNEKSTFYKLENIATQIAPDKSISHLKGLIIKYREQHFTPEIFNACNVLLKQLEFELRTASMALPWPQEEITAIRLLIARAINNHVEPKANDLTELRNLLKLDNELFGEADKTK